VIVSETRSPPVIVSETRSPPVIVSETDRGVDRFAVVVSDRGGQRPAPSCPTAANAGPKSGLRSSGKKSLSPASSFNDKLGLVGCGAGACPARHKSIARPDTTSAAATSNLAEERRILQSA